MEEYLQYVRTLRTQMNDVEDQAAKISVEEQMLATTILTLDKDLNSAKSGAKQVTDDADQMVKTRGHMCSKILENQKKVASLEVDSSTLSQTLELIQQERSNLSNKVLEKSMYYSKLVEDMSSKLQEQKGWLDSKLQNEVIEGSDMQTDVTEEMSTDACNLGDKDKELLPRKMHAAKAKLDEIIRVKVRLVSENNEMNQSVEKLKHEVNDHKPELSSMDVITLEDEHNAISSDKGGEMEYMQNLESQLKKLRGISHVIKCACGGEYKVEMGLCDVESGLLST